MLFGNHAVLMRILSWMASHWKLRAFLVLLWYYFRYDLYSVFISAVSSITHGIVACCCLFIGL